MILKVLHRGLKNLVEVVEEDIEAGRIDGVELFFLTEKSVADAVYYQGNSSDKDIFGLMLQMVYLYLRGCFILHIIWVAGMRQIAAGIDKLSKGCLKDGMSSSVWLYFRLFSFECLESLLPWVQTWIGVNKIELLTPEGWFE